MISVIVPVYKVEKYLDKCLDSILRQTYQDFELILVDDGSPDRCGAMCDAWAEKDKRIQVVHKANGGLSDARNTGISRARGEYLLFVDSDDWIDRDMLKTLHSLAVESGAELTCCNFVRVNEDSFLTRDIVHVAPGILSQDDYWRQCFAQKKERTYYEVAWNKLYKRELFREARFSLGKIHEDSLILYDIISQCRTIALSDRVGYYYLQRPDGIMGRERSLDNLSGPHAHIYRAEKFIESEKWPFAIRSLEIAVNLMLLNHFGKGGKKSPEYKAIKKRAWQTFSRLRRHLPLRKAMSLLLFFISEPIARLHRKSSHHPGQLSSKGVFGS